jgi:hypothetical protein
MNNISNQALLEVQYPYKSHKAQAYYKITENTTVTFQGNDVRIYLCLHCITVNNNNKAEYSLRESVSAQGREGRGFDSDPGRKKKRLYSIS